MTNSELYYFAGKCLSMDLQPHYVDEIREQILSGDFEDQKFVTLCSDHLILPLIYRKFQQNNLLPLLPAEMTEFLQKIYQLNYKRNTQIINQIEQITVLLNSHNISPTFLKGAAYLLDGLYADPGERMLGDIDLLVPQKDYLKAAALLEQDGYATHDEFPQFTDASASKHYPRLSKDGFPADVEIHRELTVVSYDWFNPIICFAEQRKVAGLEGGHVLSSRHQIVHNFVHSQISNGGHSSGIISFRDIYDLHLLSKRYAPANLLPIIHYRRKAIAYFHLAGKSMGLQDPYVTLKSPKNSVLNRKHALNLRSSLFYHTFRTLKFLIRKIFVNYLGLLFKSLFSSSVRQSVMQRISDPKWYLSHFKTYRDFFHPGKNSPANTSLEV